MARCGRRAAPHDLLCETCRAAADSAFYDQDTAEQLVAWAKSLIEDPDDT